jgi:hypothetical protein
MNIPAHAPLEEVGNLLFLAYALSIPVIASAMFFATLKIGSLVRFMVRSGRWRRRRPIPAGQRLCPDCGYELHAAHAERCSECGCQLLVRGVNVAAPISFRLGPPTIWGVVLTVVAIVFIALPIVPSVLWQRELSVHQVEDSWSGRSGPAIARLRQTLLARGSWSRWKGICVYLEVISDPDGEVIARTLTFSPPSADELCALLRIPIDADEAEQVAALAAHIGDTDGFARSNFGSWSSEGSAHCTYVGSSEIRRRRPGQVPLQPASGVLVAVLLTFVVARATRSARRRGGWDRFEYHGTALVNQRWQSPNESAPHEQ